MDTIQYRVDIEDTLYSSTINAFNIGMPAMDGFTISWEGDENNITNPINPSSCSVDCVVADAAFETLIDDIVGAAEGRFILKIYKHNGTAYGIYWLGYILADMIQISDLSYPYQTNITATDGIGRLANIAYKDSGSFFTGYDTLLDHIFNAIDLIGLSSYFVTGDEYLITSCQWFEDYMGISAPSTSNPLALSRINHLAFISKNEGDDRTPLSAYDVLKNICVLLDAQFIFSAGKYYFVQINEKTKATFYTNSYDSDRLALSSDTAFGISITPADRTNGYYGYLPMLASDQLSYSYRIGSNPYPGLYNPGDLFEPKDIRITLSIEEITPHWEDDAYNPIYDLTIKIGSYYYTNYGWTTTAAVYNLASGEVTSADETKIFIIQAINIPLPGILSWNIALSAESTIPGSFTWILETKTFESNYPFNVDVLAQSGTTTARLLNSLVSLGCDFIEDAADGDLEIGMNVYNTYTGELAKIVAIVNPYTLTLDRDIFEIGQGFKIGTPNFETQTQSTQLTNGSNPAASTIKELPALCIGDGPDAYSSGAIQVTNGSYWRNSASWQREGDSSGVDIAIACLQEVNAAQRTPTRYYNGQIIQTAFEAHKVLLFGSDRFIFASGAFNANFNQWTGVWHKITNAGYAGTVASTLAADESTTVNNYASTADIAESGDQLYLTALQRALLEVLEDFGFSSPEPGTLLFDGIFAVPEEFQIYPEGGPGVSILDSLPVATDIVQGIAAFSSTSFLVEEGVVSLLASYFQWGIMNGTLADQGDLQTALDLKANITYVDAAIASLIASSPTTLDTLNELAAALGDDPNFATTITTLIGTKEAAFSKNTAFNKNFGSIAGSVAEGNHSHSYDNYGYWKFAVNGTLGDAITTLDSLNFKSSGILTITRTAVDEITFAVAAQSAADLLTAIKTVDGSGSGLDADKLDGVEGVNYARTDISETFDNNVDIGGELDVDDIASFGDNVYVGGALSVYDTISARTAYRVYNSVGNLKWIINLNPSTNALEFKNESGVLLMNLDTSGNLLVKGKVQSYAL